MTDEQKLERQFQREARIGFALISAALCVFVLVAYIRISGRLRSDHSTESSPPTQTVQSKSKGADFAVDPFRPKTASGDDRTPVSEYQRLPENPSCPPDAPANPTRDSSPSPIHLGSRTPHPNQAPQNRPPLEPNIVSSTANRIELEPESPPPVRSSQQRATAAPTDQMNSSKRPAPQLQIKEFHDFPVADGLRARGFEIADEPKSGAGSDLKAQSGSQQPPKDFIDSKGEAERSPVVKTVWSPTQSDDPPSTAEQSPGESSPPAVRPNSQSDDQAPPTTVPPRNTETTRIVSADGASLWSICQREYGYGQYFRALAAFNQLDRDEYSKLPADTEIQVPPVEVLQRRFPRLCPDWLLSNVPRTTASPPRTNSGDTTSAEIGEIWVTREGDSPFSIAAERLGQAARYTEIIQRNRNVLGEAVRGATRLPAGLRLELPNR